MNVRFLGGTHDGQVFEVHDSLPPLIKLAKMTSTHPWPTDAELEETEDYCDIEYYRIFPISCTTITFNIYAEQSLSNAEVLRKLILGYKS